MRQPAVWVRMPDLLELGILAISVLCDAPARCWRAVGRIGGGDVDC